MYFHARILGCSFLRDKRRLPTRNTPLDANDTFLRPPLPLAQKRLRDLKSRISSQSKKNFVLERDVRYLDSRIALLIQNRMALDEVSQ